MTTSLQKQIGSPVLLSYTKSTLDQIMPCILSSDINLRTKLIYFIQKDGECRVHGEVTGLTPGKHGFHVHQFGDGTKGRSLNVLTPESFYVFE